VGYKEVRWEDVHLSGTRLGPLAGFREHAMTVVFCLLVYSTVWSGRRLPTFQRGLLLPLSGHFSEALTSVYQTTW
jgi:hypothetical protein